LLSLGPQHSFPLDRVPKFLASGTVEEVVRQAVLTSPMFASRWRWNLNTSLAVLRMRGGKKNPPAIQRMEADDLMAAVFPTLAACQENVAPGPLEIPDHILVRQTLEDCLRDAMDIDGLKDLVGGIETGRIRVVVRDTTEPSVLAHEILNGRPFTYLDDAPLEERRSRAVPLRRGLPVEPHELAGLDPAAIERVVDQVKPDPRDEHELHDLLLNLVTVRPADDWRPWFDTLAAAGRAVEVHTEMASFWAAVERLPAILALYPRASVVPSNPGQVAIDPPAEEVAAADMLRGHLECRGPTTAAELAAVTGLRELLIDSALAALEGEGFAIRGRFTGPGASEEFCSRRLLARMHSYTRQQRRREIEPVTARDFMRFLLRWQHVADGTRREGRFGVLAVIEQLQGFELATGAWEQSVLAARVEGYRREWLDELCMSGQVSWGRLSVKEAESEPARRLPAVVPSDSALADSVVEARASTGLAPSRATPITLALRDDLPWLLRAARGELIPAEPVSGVTSEVLAALTEHGALFRPDLAALTGRLPHEVDEALWDAVARGLVTADGFRAIRALLRRRTPDRYAPPRGLRRGLRGTTGGASGRWSLLPPPEADADRDELAEAVAQQLAARWGVVIRDVVSRENLAVPWRDVLWAFRRLEARGTMRGGRFVAGFSGEQYAHPDALDVLKLVRKLRDSDEVTRISAADPLNLTGIVLPGPRIPAIAANTVTYLDGAISDPVALAGSPA
jgi:ATP-dependent helicase Lhr and Lhr-like helicase